ncbi:MAG TPA: DUF2255 family protein [Thermoanaerobaculia bacterium]|nr:DUF2255 family protein [Thermoanaerobaculia bacterium]
MKKERFDDDVLAAIGKSMALGIRAGTEQHRVIGIWAVVVEKRVFVRSWTLKTRGWYRTFLSEPRGTIKIGTKEIPVRAVRTRSERLKSAVDRAYAAKYHTPGSLKYVKGFRVARRRDTTTELVPLLTSLRNPRSSRPPGRARAGSGR